jgi:hypothetical protein
MTSSKFLPISPTARHTARTRAVETVKGISSSIRVYEYQPQVENPSAA